MIAEDVLKLVTTPSNVPFASGRGSAKQYRHIIRVDYATDPEAARRLLPEPLKLTDIARTSIHIISYYDIYGPAPLIEVTQAIEAIGPDGMVGDFVLSVYTDSAQSLIINRESYVQSTLLGEGEVSHSDGATNFKLRVSGRDVLVGSTAFRYEEVAHEDIRDYFTRPKFFLKILGSPFLGDRPRPTLFSLTPVHVEFTQAHRSPAHMKLDGHVMAPLDDLPIRHIQSSYTVEGEWTPGSVKVIHRYN